jgi:hypothetical protein
MCPSGSALAAHGDKQLGVGHGNSGVVVDDGDDICDVVDELLTCQSVAAVGQMDPYEKLSDGHGGDRHVIVVVDQAFERRSGAVGVDEKRGVE